MWTKRGSERESLVQWICGNECQYISGDIKEQAQVLDQLIRVKRLVRAMKMG